MSLARRARTGCLLAAAPLLLIAGSALAAVVTTSHPPGAVAGVACAAPDQAAGGYSGQQLRVAAQIVAAGKELHIPRRGHIVAVAAAMQESSLTAVDHGDAAGPDSRGPLQQRASWGPESVRMDPRGSAKLFYERLRGIPNWQNLPVTVAAQSVQISAFPDAYADDEAPARQVVAAVEGITCQPSPASGANPRAGTVIAAARSQLGVRYAWGGGTPSGPSMGFGVDAGITGFDCSGLALYAYAKAGVAVPHQTQAIWAEFAHPPITEPGDVAPGDLVLLSSTGTPGGIHHVAIYLGGGAVIEAPHSGATVRITRDIWTDPYWRDEFIGAVRPGAGGEG